MKDIAHTDVVVGVIAKQSYFDGWTIFLIFQLQEPHG
jgi:hypothetical protein